MFERHLEPTPEPVPPLIVVSLGTVLHADCQAVVWGASNFKAAKSHNSPHAGYWRISGKPSFVVVKVKAHRKEEEATSALDLCHVRGNQLADHYAKIAARRNNQCAADLKCFTDA
eukprot:4799528-Pyramimonas_sp.AAC.1